MQLLSPDTIQTLKWYCYCSYIHIKALKVRCSVSSIQMFNSKRQTEQRANTMQRHTKSLVQRLVHTCYALRSKLSSTWLEVQRSVSSMQMNNSEWPNLFESEFKQLLSRTSLWLIRIILEYKCSSLSGRIYLNLNLNS